VAKSGRSSFSEKEKRRGGSTPVDWQKSIPTRLNLFRKKRVGLNIGSKKRGTKKNAQGKTALPEREKERAEHLLPSTEGHIAIS